ncbi:histone H1 [uncultured Alistipes sp.]|jgi:hypothetical protein|uniref:histone H1 n=1 Tax=uncultured Alistipes sp. TaxID=538949 RepID=UPI0025FC38D8|nr:histone H1 [uncultured Alistipes sp.]
MKTLIEKINDQVDTFQKNASLQLEKANKAAGTRARKASLEISKLMREFRKKSIEVQNKI